MRTSFRVSAVWVSGHILLALACEPNSRLVSELSSSEAIIVWPSGNDPLSGGAAVNLVEESEGGRPNDIDAKSRVSPSGCAANRLSRTVSSNIQGAEGRRKLR